MLPDLTLEDSRTDIGAARALVALFGHDLRFVHGQGWRHWNGTAWVPDESGEVVSAAKATAERLYQEAVKIEDQENRKSAVRWTLNGHSQRRLMAMIDLAASEPGVRVKADVFDRESMVLNLVNGTFDLKTGQLRPHRRDDMITKIAGTKYEPEADCPRWLAFLDRIFAGNQNLITYVRRLYGYCTTADTREEIIAIFHGAGQNGKSKALSVLMEVLGDYARTAPMRALLVSRNEEHPTAIAGLMGARVVTGTETDEGRRLAEATVKQLTGGDRVTARRMREDYTEFVPTFKIILAVNHKPEIRGTDLAIWRRIHLIPFNVTIPEEERDRGLLDKLRPEYPGILSWMLAGCLEWQRRGLDPPAEVTSATAEYRKDQDVVKSFLEAACIVGDGYSASKKSMFSAYRSWCESSGESAISQRKLSERLKERGLESGKSENGHFWKGVGLREDAEA